MFSAKGLDGHDSEPASSLFRVLQQLLEACALHAVEFDAEEHAAFRNSMRDIAERFEKVGDYKDLLILAGETNKTIQAYNHLVERFIRQTALENHMVIELLAQSLLRVSNSSDNLAQSVRQIERDLAKTTELHEMRRLRHKLTECAGKLCLEAEAREAQYRDFKDSISVPSTQMERRDEVTGLNMLKSAESRMKEVAAGTNHGHVTAFFLKNVDVVNRRLGFSAGDDVLRQFAVYLGHNAKSKDQLFRWRGPCFVLVTERFASIDEIQADALRLGIRGPEVEVESAGKSMLIRLTAATAVFAIPKGEAIADVSGKIDEFASMQFNLSPPAK